MYIAEKMIAEILGQINVKIDVEIAKEIVKFQRKLACKLPGIL